MPTRPPNQAAETVSVADYDAARAAAYDDDADDAGLI